MHPDVREAIEQIDAAVFNGDTFADDDERGVLVGYLARWRTRLCPPGSIPLPFDATELLKIADACERFHAEVFEAGIDPCDEAHWREIAFGFLCGSGVDARKLTPWVNSVHEGVVSWPDRLSTGEGCELAEELRGMVKAL